MRTIPRHILFVCTGNTCRSPMAAAFAVRLARERGLDVRVSSAGLCAAAAPASAQAVQVMAEQGISLAGHRAQPLSQALCDRAEIILTMTAAQRNTILHQFIGTKDKTFLLSGGAEAAAKAADVADPFGGGLEEYRRSRDEIAECVRRIFEKWRERP